MLREKLCSSLDELMQKKICEQSSMPETKHARVALANKLRPNLDHEPKQSLPTRTYPTPSTSAQPERNDALVASFSHKLFCFYFEKQSQRGAKSEKILQC